MLSYKTLDSIDDIWCVFEQTAVIRRCSSEIILEVRYDSFEIIQLERPR